MCAAPAACTTGERPLRLGTTHTVEQSGALAVLDSLAHPVPSGVIGPSGQILAAAARGDLDDLARADPPRRNCFEVHTQHR